MRDPLLAGVSLCCYFKPEAHGQERKRMSGVPSIQFEITNNEEFQFKFHMSTPNTNVSFSLTNGKLNTVQ